jgi:hypothetical protein
MSDAARELQVHVFYQQSFSHLSVKRVDWDQQPSLDLYGNSPELLMYFGLLQPTEETTVIVQRRKAESLVVNK